MALYEWTARIEFDKCELGSSFSALLFLGKVPDDPEEWQVSPNFVGSHSAFSTGGCRSQPSEGFVHLDRGILEHSGLHSLEPKVIEPYLTRALEWRVQLVMSLVKDNKP